MSITQTTTKKKQDAGDDQHSGIGARYIVLHLNKRLKGHGLGTWKFAQNYSTSIIAVSGAQAVQTIMALCMINQFTTNTATPGVGQIRSNLFDLNASRVNTGSTLIPSVAKPATDRMAVYHVRVNMLFTNLESASTIVYLYFITPKVNCVDLAEVAWTKAMAGEGMTVPVHTQAAAGTYGGTTAGSGVAQDLFSRPNNFSYFKSQYKVLRVLKLKMAAGATEEVNVSAHINKVVKYQQITNAGGLECFKGLNIQCMAVSYGQAVHDDTAGGAYITTAGTKVGMVGTATYTCGMTKAVAATRFDDFFINQQISYNAATANQKNIDIGDAIAGVDVA